MKKISVRPSKFMLWTLWMIPLLMITQITNAQPSSLLHRYSFDGAPGTTVITDSVGGANGTLMNGSATAELTGSGQLVLDGNASSGWVSLPSRILPQLTNATFETWVENQNPNSDWSELWTFGTNNGSVGIQYLTMVANDPPNSEIRLDEGAGGIIHASESLPLNSEVCLTVVYDSSISNATIYVNGRKMGSGTMTIPLYTIPDPDNYIGQSQYYGSGDPYLIGTLDEFRIYNDALTPSQVEADYEAGANNINAAPGNLTTIEFGDSPNSIVGAVISPVILGTYSGVTNNVDITALPGITYSSDNTNVIAFEGDGNFHAVGVGSTTIRASYQSLNAALAVTVAQEPIVLLHRYSFDGAQGTTTIADSAGGANGTLMNGSATAELTGNGQLVLDGNASSAWVSLPSGITPQLTNATFETWVENQNPNSDWSELWTFGTNNGSAGIHYFTLIPNDPPGHKIRLDDGSVVYASESLPLSNEVCLAVVYNYLAQNASIYVNGRKMGSGTMNLPLYTLPDSNNYIGQSQFYGGGDPYVIATLDEFRIYSGAESDIQVAIDSAAGPNNFVANAGALVSVMVGASSTNVDAHSLGEPIQVLANFANVTNVDVSTLPNTTFTVSNPSVGTMVNGNFVPQNAGVCTVTGTYSNISGSLVITVADTNAWPTLLHRWSFNEPPGSTTLTDLVGSVNGTVNGPAVFDGQKMTTPSIADQQNSNSGANGQPAASAAWVAFPGGEGLVAGLPNEASFEIWVEWNGSQEWAELFDFGQAATPGVSSGGGQYVMVCGQDSTGVMRAEWDQNPAYDVSTEAPTALPSGTLCQVVLSHDQDRQSDKLYLNGKLVANSVNTALWSTLPDTDNWLARDEWPDPVFSGEYYDLRIWDGALTAGQVANLYKAGPSVIVGPSLNIAASGANQITLQWPANATEFTLQSSTSLVGGTWSTVSGTPTVINGLNNLTLPITPSQAYYRLKQ
jgi:Concanavalin A-like lectin/glucanases superfamily